MVSEKYNIRVATPDDLNEMVDLHCACFKPREHMALYLGKGFIRSMYFWFINSDRTLTIVAEDLGKIIGLHTACSGPYFKLLFSQNKKALFKALAFHPYVIFIPSVLKRVLKALIAKNDRLQNLSNDSSYLNLGIIAIDPHYRLKGLGVALADGLVEIGHHRGWRKFYLITYASNQGAARVLKHSGGWHSEPLGKNKLLWIKTFDFCSNN